MTFRSLAGVLALSTALALAGCGSDEPAAAPASPTPSPSVEPSPSPTEDAGVVVDIEFAGGKVTPQGARVDVEVGEVVTLRVTSDATDELHVHSTPEQTFAVKPGDSEFTLTIDRPGQVAVESHHLHVTVVQLVVR